MKTKLGYSLLIFILTVFMATYGVVSSSSLYNTTASNNIEKIFATTGKEQEQEQQPCAEGEVFNEETQTCEIVEEENEQGTDADEEQQQQQQQLESQQQQPCAEGEVF